MNIVLIYLHVIRYTLMFASRFWNAMLKERVLVVLDVRLLCLELEFMERTCSQYLRPADQPWFLESLQLLQRRGLPMWWCLSHQSHGRTETFGTELNRMLRDFQHGLTFPCRQCIFDSFKLNFESSQQQFYVTCNNKVVRTRIE